MRTISYISIIIGILSFLYLIAIISYSGSGTAFLWFWTLLGFAGILFGTALLICQHYHINIPKTLHTSFFILLTIGLLIFLSLEALLITYGNKTPEPGSEYLIVLGAQVRGTTISRALKNRLDTAYDYLIENETTTIIVSGGKGPGEDITEAQAMSQYLQQRGIPSSRIIQEDQSTNTYENFKFSKEKMKDATKSVVIVTNDFHVFRSLHIAKKLGFCNTSGLGAPSDDLLIVHYYVREFLAVIKDKLVGNI